MSSKYIGFGFTETGENEMLRMLRKYTTHPIGIYLGKGKKSYINNNIYENTDL